MITFRKVTWQNFLSTGNTPIEVELDKNSSTLVIGDNGSGKSTVLDALTFGLFGKPFRNIKKDQLVNSVNERGCKVEVIFQIGQRKFNIIRSIKPTRFEIYVDGKMLNQDANVRDYQKHLENNILKLNYRSFTQVVILGSSSFVPFMQLTPAHRREVVEEILDIKIFSLMNMILKQRIKDTKERQTDIAHQSEMLDTKIDMTTKHIHSIKEKSKISGDALFKKIDNNKKSMEELAKEIDRLQGLVNYYDNISAPERKKLQKTKSELMSMETKIRMSSQGIERDIKFLQENDECHTCHQPLSEHYKEKHIFQLADQLMSKTCGLTKLTEEINKNETHLKVLDKRRPVRDESYVQVAKRKTSVEAMEQHNRDLLKEIEDLRSIDVELVEDKTKLKLYKEDLKSVKKEKDKLMENNNYLTIAKQLLQDSGIKTKIIKRYLPVMNKLINSYLSALEFQVKFELDEQFNETIKSRYRDVFGYSNFSEGEKMRIDLALLFTWRQIAKMKNSTNTNLLILDEIFDSSLDANGTDEFLKILNTLSNENVFIISHKSDLNVDKFDGLMRFEKINNFTRLTT